MEPFLPKPNNLESAPAATEQQPILNTPNTETVPNTAPEKSREGVTSGQASVHQPIPTATVLPVVPSTTTSSGDSTTNSAAAPLIADDVDVIEKEWVDKAKKIVSATREDPHLQEKEVSKLQADYLMKRYNKKVKLTE